MSDEIVWTDQGDGRHTSNQGHTAQVVGGIVVVSDKDGNVVAGVPRG